MPLIYFTDIDKYCIGVADVPQKILNKLVEHHLNPMDVVRSALGIAIWASEESGFRPYNWEIAKGRSGTSQHTFGQKKSGLIYDKELGAIDWTCSNFADNKERFLQAIIDHTKYTRMAVYNSFIHCDYKATDNGKRTVYDSTPNSIWTQRCYVD
tara:strand:+ start:456 stop:917 length:462 start_codon:yes stop_codon:yes gene_type:complete